MLLKELTDLCLQYVGTSVQILGKYEIMKIVGLVLPTYVNCV